MVWGFWFTKESSLFSAIQAAEDAISAALAFLYFG